MEEKESQTNSEKIKEYERLSKKICKVHLYDTLIFLACVSAGGAFAERAIFPRSGQDRKVHVATAVGLALAYAGIGRCLDKRKQKLIEQKTQILKELNQCSRA